MSWEKDIQELKRREKLAEKMGGEEKLKRQKDNTCNRLVLYRLDKNNVF